MVTQPARVGIGPLMVCLHVAYTAHTMCQCVATMRLLHSAHLGLVPGPLQRWMASPRA